MYSKKYAQLIDLNVSTELARVVSTKQLQQIDFVCLFFFFSKCKNSRFVEYYMNIFVICKDNLFKFSVIVHNSLVFLSL